MRSILTPSLLVTEHIDTTQSCCLGDAGDFVVQGCALNQHRGSGVRSDGILHNSNANNSGKLCQLTSAIVSYYRAAEINHHNQKTSAAAISKRGTCPQSWHIKNAYKHTDTMPFTLKHVRWDGRP